ncbi:rhomboid family membrane protein [Fusarium austroafricanum]|uniref:Rhomboid family membrane protein n=1 Tax=Fusarium austroafricanum TaxID=2364996 RepID=A0A8H4K8W1_9HYPO|nr:rhomboid family membrane protein [Fusarium austroafricanum]
MSQDQPQVQPPLPPRNEFIHNSALAGAVIAPLAMLLPPRKIDFRFLVLAGAFSLATNQLAYEYTGSSIYSRFGNTVGSIFGAELPEGAQRTQRLLREHREREAALKAKLGQHSQQSEEEKTGVAKALNDVWMGGEEKNWREQRAKEHQQKIEEGKGIGDIIVEQVADVWSGNWGKSAKKQNGENSTGDVSSTDRK